MRDQRSHASAAPPSLEGVKVTRLPSPGGAEVAYMVLSSPSKASGDKRAERRWRTHLRSGKIVAGGAHIVAESQVRDRSARGLRLKLAANILLPKRIRFFDDVAKRMYEGVVAWQRGRDIGISLGHEIDTGALTRAELYKLGIKLRN